MPKIPIVPARKLIKVVKKRNFVLERIVGSHHIFVNHEDKLTISIPVHPGHDLGRGITLAILKDAHISVDDFIKLL